MLKKRLILPPFYEFRVTAGKAVGTGLTTLEQLQGVLISNSGARDIFINLNFYAFLTFYVEHKTWIRFESVRAPTQGFFKTQPFKFCRKVDLNLF